MTEDYRRGICAAARLNRRGLADGLDQPRQHYLDHGLEPDATNDAALAEFGDPQVVLAEFTRFNLARHAARRPLANR